MLLHAAGAGLAASALFPLFAAYNKAVLRCTDVLLHRNYLLLCCNDALLRYGRRMQFNFGS
jgi:hypothetical protein